MHRNIISWKQNLDFKSDVDRLGSLAKLLNETLKTSERREMRVRLMGNSAKRNKVKS